MKVTAPLSKRQPTIDIVIPSYQRGDVLLNTIEALRKQANHYSVLHIIDQTQYTENDSTASSLRKLHDDNAINWQQLMLPSIPNAMNQGLLTSTADFVLFLDDDIEPSPNLLAEHLKAVELVKKQGEKCVAAVGQILQPGEVPTVAEKEEYGKGFTTDLEFPFNSTEMRSIKNCMAGNLLVDRKAAIACGGFDMNFTSVAYRFETEFCRRLIEHSGGQFYFVPNASLDHLKVERGGTRSQVVNFLKSSRPDHSMGEYYFILRHLSGFERWRFLLKRFFGCIKAKFYVRQPWWIPVRLLGESRGFFAAWKCAQQAAKLINETSTN